MEQVGGACGPRLAATTEEPGVKARKGKDIGRIWAAPDAEAPAGAVPLFSSSVAAGFPSPADDFVEKKLDLNELLVRHPSATFFVRVDGDSMEGAGIQSGDILVVDRALQAAAGRVVVAVLDGELTVKRLERRGRELLLVAENSRYEPIRVTDQTDFQVWGVVTHVIHSV
jgi:DNA polymerase V